MNLKEITAIYGLSQKKPTPTSVSRFIGTIVLLILAFFKSFSNKLYLILFIIVLVDRIIKCDFERLKYNLNYKDTEWYKNTHYSPMQVLSDKGVIGEYIATYYARYMLDKNKIYGKIFNSVVIPKKGTDFTEVDLIVVSEVGIDVIEVKNRVGTFRGNWYDKNWTQIAGRDQNESSNFILQNIGHINALLTNLYDVFKETNYLPRVNLSHVVNNLVLITSDAYSLDIVGDDVTPERNYNVQPATYYKNLKFREIDKVLSKVEVDEISKILRRCTGYTTEQMERFINQRAYSYENNTINNRPVYGIMRNANDSKWYVYRTNGYETLYKSKFDGLYYADPDPRSMFRKLAENGRPVTYDFEAPALEKLRELER